MRRVLTVLLLVFLPFITVSCGPLNPSGKTVLRVAYWGNPEERKTKSAIIEAFQKEYPDIRIKAQPTDWPYFEKIITALAGGDAPDVFLLDAEMINLYASKGQLSSLDGFVVKEGDGFLKGIIPEVLPVCRWDGALYGLPNQFYTLVMYYNKDLFDQAGIPYPSGDWTWEEFIASARKLTKFNENGAAVQFGVSGIGGSWQYLVLAAQSGAEIFDPARSRCLLGSRQAIAAAKFLKRLRDEERICPNAAEAETTQPMAAFQIGRAAMHISGQWLIPELRNYQSLRWSAAPMPRMKTGPSRTYMGVHAFVISAQTKNPDAAWKFVRYTVSEKAQRQIASLRINMPVLQRIAYSEEFADDPASPDEGNRVGLEARKNAFTIPSTPACPVTMIKTILDEELDRMYENVGTSTPEQAMGEVARRIDLELKRK